MLGKGDTFLGRSESGETYHLWVVLNELPDQGGSALIVNLSTLHPGAETTCVVGVGEHPFIRHDSYARFASAKIAASADLEKLIKGGMLLPREPATSAFVAKLRAGAAVSPNLPAKCRDFL